MMFSCLADEGVVGYNPAREVKTEKVRRLVGITPSFEDDVDVVRLLESFDTSHPKGVEVLPVNGIPSHSLRLGMLPLLLRPAHGRCQPIKSGTVPRDQVNGFRNEEDPHCIEAE